MKRKILHIAAHLGGGAGKAISGLAIGLNSYYDNEVVLLEKPEQDRYVKLCKDNNVNVNVISFAMDLVEYIEKSDFVIFSWWGHPLSHEVYKALNKTNTVVLLWSHVNGLHYPHLTFEFIELFDGAFFTSGCTYENTGWTKEQQEQIRDNSEIVYGIGLFKPEDIPSKNGYGTDNRVKIGYSGTINYNKMNLVFPKVCSKIREQIPDLEIYMYGLYDDAVYRSFVTYDNSLAEVMHFEGFVNDIESRLAELDVFCYPLNEENYATTENALLEAMAVGVPVVVLNNPAERNIITHRVDGLIANGADEMIEYVIKLTNDKAFAQSLGESARKGVIARYDYLVNASKCAEYIKRFEHIEKHEHNFLSVVGDSAGANYLYFAQMSSEQYKKKMKQNELPEILCGDAKGSLKHYMNYYSDKILEELKL